MDFILFLVQEACAIFFASEKRHQVKETLPFLFDQIGCSVIVDV